MAVPVVMADGYIQPFESLVDWRRFSVAVDTAALQSAERGDRTALDDLHNLQTCAIVWQQGWQNAPSAVWSAAGRVPLGTRAMRGWDWARRSA